MKSNYKTYAPSIIVLLAILMNCACTKNFLDEKPNKKIVIPGSLSDLQSLLDNDSKMNSGYPSAGEEASDNGWVDNATWQALPFLTYKNIYIWDKNVFSDIDRNDWSIPYNRILYANICLEGVNQITPTTYTLSDWQNVKGAALFYRSWCFWNLAQEFAKLYDPATAASDPGIVLKLSSDLNSQDTRSSVQETYSQMIADAKESLLLLPASSPVYKTRPSKAAAYGLLSRIYLSMRKYPEAGLYADSCLQLNNTLLNYNTLSASATNPVKRYNTEVVFHCIGNSTSAFFTTARYRADSNLYLSYNNNDLRRTIFFKIVKAPNIVSFYGSYDGSNSPFDGIATDEMYLVKAECLARDGMVTESMNTLNQLMITRWKTGTFIPFTASTKEEALTLVLTERRKELITRSLRWTDLRRLNKETGRETTITRNVNNQVYQLLPGDKRYVFPIPNLVINMSGIAQND